jgi:hypothetical protein
VAVSAHPIGERLAYACAMSELIVWFEQATVYKKIGAGPRGNLFVYDDCLIWSAPDKRSKRAKIFALRDAGAPLRELGFKQAKMSAQEVLAADNDNWRVDLSSIEHLWYYLSDTGSAWAAGASAEVRYLSMVEIQLTDGSRRKFSLRRFEKEDRPGLRRFRDLLGDRVTLGKP